MGTPSLLGCDFSSSPTKRKPIVLALGEARQGRVQLQSLRTFDTLSAFGDWLAQPADWLGGFDLPFGLPRELVQTLGWPTDWAACMDHYCGLERSAIREQFAAFCHARPVGGKFAHRAADRPAGSSPSMKWVNPPVAYMLHAGVPLLRVHLSFSMLHPLYDALGFTWIRGKGVDVEGFRPDGSEEDKREAWQLFQQAYEQQMKGQLEEAVSLLLQIEKTVVEGAGAAGLAALLANPDMFRGRNVGIVLCGGNIDTRLLANVLLRDLVRSGRLARIRLRLQDRPGALFGVFGIFAQVNANVLEIYHQRVFTTLPAKGLITDIECELRDRAHLEALLTALAEGGYDASLVELA